MLTEAQIQYVTEVLGTSVETLFAAPQPSRHELVVLTPPLDPEQKTLLDKILGSIQLNTYVHLQSEEIAVGGPLPENADAQNVLAFLECTTCERIPRDGATWWCFHSLKTMLGTSQQVAQTKKAVWALLQQFKKERART